MASKYTVMQLQSKLDTIRTGDTPPLTWYDELSFPIGIEIRESKREGPAGRLSSERRRSDT